jgi:hypothetical protein
MVNQFKFLQSNDVTVLDENWYQNYVPYVPNDTQTHGFCVGVHRTQLILHYEGDMDIESVRAMTWDLQFRYANYVSINEQIIGFMEDFLNEHLSGTSTIRLA